MQVHKSNFTFLLSNTNHTLMKYTTCCLFLFLSSFYVYAQNSGGEVDLVQYVNPLVGTESSFEVSHGNTYPAIALPWGMNFWSPQTGEMGSGWMYTYQADQLRGIKQTHQPSPWINDYGCFSLMPVVGELHLEESQRASRFSHQEETAQPHYYQVHLQDYDVRVEVTPTERAAMFRITYPQTDSAFLILDAFEGGSQVKIIPEENKIVGYSKFNRGGVPDNFASYFVAVFDQPFQAYGTWRDGTLTGGNPEQTGEHTMGYVQFESEENRPVLVRIASSFISLEQAERNLQQEIGKADFEQVKTQGAARWNQELNKIKVTGSNEEQKTIFYTALYRTLLFPRMFYEYDAQRQIMHYSPFDGKVHEGYLYTDNGFWDTFRAVHPFFTLMFPERSRQIMQSLVNTYREGGWLPSWISPGYRQSMIGAHSASLIADAYTKGIRDFDVETAYEGMLKDATQPAPMAQLGRDGFQEYNQLGYVPYPEYHESTAKTLEYAYDDFCIMQMAKALGKKEDVALYRQRAMNYRNVFDPQTKFMRGRRADGSWLPSFSPKEWGGPFTEGSSWHYTWSVFHDPQGLIDLIGGQEAFVEKLDAVFATPAEFEVGTYGQVIHEMTEMVLGYMGQYAHGNQPIQHMIYLYNYAGAPWKAQHWLRRTMNKLYGPGPDGLCGDEDNGQTSAWFVFSALGFYPVCPGTGQYVIGSPLFDKVDLQLPNGRTFTIEAKGNRLDHPYIQSARLGGKEHTRTWISHEEILKGGTFTFDMGKEPNKSWGTGADAAPYSLSQN